MVGQRDPEVVRKEEEAEREFIAEVGREKREHDLAMARLETSIKERHKTWRFLIKLPALVILAIWIPILLLCNSNVPKELYDFLNV